MSFPNTEHDISFDSVTWWNSIAWLYFKASGFLFVLVPVSISSKITVVRIDSVKGRRGLLILRKCIMWQFVMSVGLTKTVPHFWSGWCYLVDCLFSVAFGRWKIQAPGWDTGREWRDLFLKKQNIKKKKKSCFLSPAVWLLHNWELNCTKSLLYTQLNKLSPLLTSQDSHVCPQAVNMNCVKKFKVAVFLNRVLRDIHHGRGRKCCHCLECYNMNILVSTSYCGPTSHFIFIFLLSIDVF